MKNAIEYPEGSGITIRRIANSTNDEKGRRIEFGCSWLAVVPAKRTHGKGRLRKQCDSLDDAKQWADHQHKALNRLGTGFLELDDRERAQAVSAFHLVRESGLCKPDEAGSFLTKLVADAISAVRILGSSERLGQAASYYHERKGKVVAMPVLDAIEHLKREKEQDGISTAHLTDLRLRLGHFADKFGATNVADLDARQIDEWLRSLDVGKRSRVNYRRVVLTFLRFCERRGWLARGAIDGEAITKPKVKSNGPIGVFKPEELRVFLEQSNARLRPYFVLGGLCGLRTAESLRLEWNEVDFKRNTITIEAGKAKTASRRIVPLCAAAREWLLPLRKPSGRVLPYYHVAKEVDRLLVKLNQPKSDKDKAKADKDKLEWKSNGLRHTYVSARIAVLKDANKVATECGNSPAMVFSNYRELMHEDSATEWFGIMPKTPANVTQMPEAAVG